MKFFWVYQGKTYDLECKGGYVWSPQKTKNGGINKGYENMRLIKKGDIIFHCCKGYIKAISEAKSDCYEADQPAELIKDQAGVWNKKGYKVNLKYQNLFCPYHIDYKDREWLARNYEKGCPFQCDGGGRMTYMNPMDMKYVKYFLNILSRSKGEYINVLDFINNLQKQVNFQIADTFDEVVKVADPKFDETKLYKVERNKK